MRFGLIGVCWLRLALTWRASGLLGFLGGTILAAAAMDVYPAILLAQIGSPDGNLSAPYLAMLKASQCTVGWCLLIGALVAPWAEVAAQRWRPALTRLPAPKFYALLFMLAFGLCLATQRLVFDNIPHISDATSHVFQAKIFSRGHLWAPNPPCCWSFFQDNVVMSYAGRWHTKYFPGHALWLTLGELAGLGWASMPLAMAGAAVLLGLVTRRFFDDLTARLTAILFVFSPLVLLTGASFMSHMTLLLFALAMVTLLQYQFRWTDLAAGLAGGLALLTRPLDFLLVAMPCGVLLLWHYRRTPMQGLRRVPWLAAGFLPPLGFLLYWNFQLYGAIGATGYNFNRTHSITPIIRDAIGFSAQYTLASALGVTMANWRRLNQALFGWPTSLLFVALALPGLARDRRILVCVAGVVAVTAAFMLFMYGSVELEARYYSLLAPPLIVLTVMGIKKARRMAGRSWSSANSRVFCTGVVLACSVYAAAYYWPRYLWPKYSDDYEWCSPTLGQLAQRAGLQHALVIIPALGDMKYGYAAGFIHNDPWLSNDIIYAREWSPEQNQCLRDNFPGRRLVRFHPHQQGRSGVFTDGPAPRAADPPAPQTPGPGGP